jgi:type I restriction enzyme S subunit
MAGHLSKIEKLIAELCPDGVEFKELGEIGVLIRGNGLQRKDFTESGIGCVHYGQIYTYYGIFADKTKSFVSEALAKKLKKAQKGDVLIAGVSENVEDVLKPLGWLGGEICISGDMFAFRHNQNVKFITYLLQTVDFQKYKEKHVHGTKVIRVSADKILKFIIPVPPVGVQEEIVKILDSFTQLEAELEAELEARGKQYEHYRTELLTLSPGSQVIALGDLCEIRVGELPDQKSFISNGDFPFVNAGNEPSGYLLETNTKSEAITIPSRGQGGAGHVGYQKRDFWCGPLCYRIRSKNAEVLTRYVYYFLRSTQETIVGLRKTGSIPAVNKSDLISVRVLIPSLAEQVRIVSILDKFDTLVNDISVGLPAEIKARRRQYEYYRNKLLTFTSLSQ